MKERRDFLQNTYAFALYNGWVLIVFFDGGA